MIAVRAGRPADAALLAEFAARTFEETFGALNDPADMALYLETAYGLPQQSAELADPAFTVLVAEAAGALAGYAQLRSGPAPPCVTGSAPIQVLRFYVDRPWQGRGVASALMNAAMAEARARGARTLWLCAWERNDRALAFYRKCGFAVVGSVPFQLGTDRQTDVIMTRDLP